MSAMRSHLVALRGTIGTIRTATFEGREHVVLPVVALVEGVIHASNSAHPELVLASEFGKVPQAWDGRPVMLDHPQAQGEKVSANEPEVLGRSRLGYVFHAEVKDKRLLMEAYLDPERVDAVGGEAPEILRRVREGELVEVSVGVFVTSEEKAGEFEGRRFLGVWRDIVPDHLALLREGTEGACSVEMGCGTPRDAVAAQGGGNMKRLMDRFAALIAQFRPAAEEETSDSQLRSLLEQALFAEEPGYLGVVDVFPDSALVVYATAPEGEVRFFRRPYTQADDTVSLGDREEVRQVTKYEPITTAAAAPCGSGAAAVDPPAGKELDMDRKQRIDALVASGEQCFSAEQLEKMDDAALATLEAHIAAAVKTTPPAEPPAAAPPAATLTPEQEAAAFLASHPDIAAAVEAHRAAETSERKTSVAKLLAAQKAYAEPELLAMPLPELRKLVAAVVREHVDFAPAAPRGDDKEVIPPPPGLRAAILEMRSKKSA